MPKSKKDNQTEILNGRQFEEIFFGITGHKIRRPIYVDWDPALIRVIQRQSDLGWDPRIPKTTLSHEFFECIKSYLPSEKAVDLRLFCCLGTTLDWHHGIDGFFMLDGIITTIDLSLKKKADFKADFLISPPDSPFTFWRICKEIAQKLMTQSH